MSNDDARSGLFSLRLFGDPVLRTPAKPVTDLDSIRDLLPVMKAVMDAADGVGLAAPQIGVMKRLLMIRLPADPDEEDDLAQLLTLANPILAWTGEEKDIQLESCLSIPVVAVPVPRATRCRIEAETEAETISLELSGHAARIAQHELDHLDGRLILDRTTSAARKQAITALVDHHLDRYLLSPAPPKQGRPLQDRR